MKALELRESLPRCWRRSCGPSHLRVNAVAEGRATRVWASINTLAAREGTPPSVRHACIACAQAVTAIGAGLSMTRDGGLREPVFATDSRSDELQELQFTLGEGPYMEVLSGGGPVLAADLSSTDTARRWPIFAPAAVERGVRAVFSFPVQAGAIRFGVLEVYRPWEGPLSADELTDALLCADAALELALDDRGGITVGLEDLLDKRFIGRHAVVHQAAGMVSVQLGATITDGLAWLRAHAYAHDQRLELVATDVVARKLRSSLDTPLQDTGGSRNNGADPPAETTKEGDR